MKDSNRESILEWLLESVDPGVRYLTLRDLVGLEINDPELKIARRDAHKKGPIAEILSKMHPDGYWVKSGPGYNPKYRSSVWSLILLSQLGASITDDERISKACNHILDHSLTGNGQFSVNGTPSGTIDCLQGNLCAALTRMGCEDTRLRKAFDWMARSVTGEGIAPASERDAPLRYFAYKCGSHFACGVNNKLPCGWGATKVMMAFAALPEDHHTPLITRAIQQGVDFLFTVDPATAAYPCGNSPKPSTSWWKFGFPVFYVTDILQVVETLVNLGYGDDPRLKNALDLVQSKQGNEGRWSLEYEYTGKTWVDFGEKNQPNKWVTFRAVQVLRQ